MRHRRPTALAVGVIAALVALGGCSDDGGSDDAASPTAADTSSTTAPSDTATTTAGALPDDAGLADEGIGALDELARSLLIQEGELGDPPLTDAGYSPAVSSAVCGSSVDADHPADVLVGVVLQGGASTAPNATSVVEEIRVYADPDAATAAYDAVATTGCTEATAITPEVDADRAVLFEPRGPATLGTFVLAQIADTILAFRVTGDGLDPTEVAAFGIGKVVAALEN